MTTAYLIHGFTGAGKTTFAKTLEQDTGAVRFSPDEWMVRLHGTNPPIEKFQQYYDSIDKLVWDMAALFLQKGHDVIMDMGFWDRASRDYAREFVKKHNAEVKLYALSCPENIMRQRVLERTRSLPPGALIIDENALELFKTQFQVLAPDEERITIDTSS